jgi:hypothetical protein
MFRKLVEELEKEAEEDFSKIVIQEWVTKHKAARVLGYHERSIRNFVNEGKLTGYHDKEGYHIRTVSLAAFRYRIMSNLSRQTRFKAVHELFLAHHLVRK